MHLGRAAERVRVLNLVAPAVRLYDRRALDEPQDVRRRVALARQRAKLVHFRNEAGTGALQGFERQGAGDVGRSREPACAHEPERPERRHELRAVDEREPLLGLERHRVEPDGGERVGAGKPLSVHARATLPDEGQGQMRERSEVAARSDRPSAWHIWDQAGRQATEQELHHLHACP